MGARLRPSYRGIGEMLRADFMLADMVRRAEEVKATAESIAPVYEQGRHPGRYKAAFRVEADPRGGHRHDRAVGRVVNDSPEAFIVEYGNRNTPRHRTLGKALDAAGD